MRTATIYMLKSTKNNQEIVLKKKCMRFRQHCDAADKVVVFQVQGSGVDPELGQLGNLPDSTACSSHVFK